MKTAVISRHRSLSYAFSGAGWLTPFHLGVISALRKRNLIGTSSTVAGSSGGAIASALCAVGTSEHDALAKFVEFSNEFKVMSNIDWKLRLMLLETIPKGSYHSCNNKLFITVTDLKPRPVLKTISHFESDNDLIACIATSCYIPFYCGPTLSVSFRGRQSIDGGLFAFLPPVGEITISPLPAIGKYVPNARRSVIHPYLVPGFKVPLRRMLRWAFFPESPEVLKELFDIGVASGDVWANTLQE